MATAISEPTTRSSHGAPIPSRDGTLDEDAPVLALDQVDVGARVCVQRVGDRDAEQLQFISTRSASNRVVGWEVLSREPFDGPISLRVGHAW